MVAIRQETGIRESLFRDIPAYFNRGPEPVPGFTIVYNGLQAFASIAQRQLSITGIAALGDATGYGETPLGEEPPPVVSSGMEGNSLVIDLRGKTLADVVAEINERAGYSAALVGNAGTVAAIALVPVQSYDLVFDPILYCFTSTLWCLQMSCVYALEDIGEQIERGAQQLYLDTAEGKWVDNWGVYYASVQRRLTEQDRTYAQRIMREVTRWKLNRIALEQIIEEETGLPARITNLYEQAWEVGGRLGRLAGRKYARTTFEVLVNGLSDVIVGLVLKYKAAGTLPFFRYQLIQGGGGNPEEEDVTIVQRVQVKQDIRDRYAWVLGRDRLSALRIGGTECTVINLWLLAVLSENYLSTLDNTTVVFVLGIGLLGENALGNIVDFGVLVSEGPQEIV